MIIDFDTNSMLDYQRFLKLKSVPSYSWCGLRADVPEEYAAFVVDSIERHRLDIPFTPSEFCFDYQRDIAALAVRKRKFAVFADCGLGKTVIALEFARHALNASEGKILWVSPLMVIDQTIDECRKFYGDNLPLEQVAAADLQDWLDGKGGRFGITNYEAIRAGLHRGKLSGLILDESSNLKSHYGAWGTRLIKLGRGLEWKLALTGTPAPNDRIEYANHAVFCDHFRTTNEFLASYFINKGQTQERWILKPHALRPFYRDLSHWCIFLTDPSVYGWKDNCETIPPIHVHIDDVPMTDAQRKAVQKLTGCLTVKEAGGIGQRSKLSAIAKGIGGIPTNKPKFIADLLDSWKGESSIIWCHRNPEQDAMEKQFPKAASIQGNTPIEKRRELIAAFKAGEIADLISKPKVLGFGLNLQVATRQVFNGMNDCFDESAEILTDQGWRNFGSIPDGGSVATISPESGNLEWQVPTRIVWQPYCGPMVRFNGQRNFDLLVTPNHRMWVKRCEKRFPGTGGEWHFRTANEVSENFKRQELRMLSCPRGFVGHSPRFIANDQPLEHASWSTTKTISQLQTSTAVKLAAWYLTEGYCRPKGSSEFGRITICQTDKNPENRREIIELLRSIAGHVDHATKDIKCYSVHLAAWLINEFGHGSHFKKMPNWLKNLDSSHLCLLRDTMISGDGISDGAAYRTASRRLADDFQEICLKTGIRASVKPRTGVCAAYPNDVIFDVNLAWQFRHPSIHQRPTIESYTGMIGCVTVPNGLIVVRRNGIPCVTGNSYEDYYQAVKRSNRIGSTKPLNVHIPITEIEEPMVSNVLRKAHRVEHDAREQELLFKQCRLTKDT